MKKNMTKENLIETIEENLEHVVSNKEGIGRMKEHLAKNGITGGYIESLLTNPEQLKDIDMRELALITEQFFVLSKQTVLDPNSWFTQNEMKTARLYDKRVYTEVEQDIEVVFENVSLVDDKVMLAKIDIATISKLMDAQILYYDFNIQREAKRSRDGINKKATVYHKNVREISSKMLKGKLKPTTIVLNALVGSSDTGEEIDYDPSTRTARINKGVRLAILDGYHRCLGSIDAYKTNPNLKFNFILELTNYTTKEAQEWQADHAKATPISKTRIQMFESNRHADAVTQSLMADSELKDRIAEQHRISPSVGELVSYNVITDAIDREFPMEFRRDTVKVADYLREFFDYLIADNSEEFLNNSDDSKSLMAYNKMFAGYIALAAKMQKENIDLDKLDKIIKSIDFSRDNKVWNELEILNDKGVISNKANDKKIANHFKNLKLENILGEVTNA